MAPAPKQPMSLEQAKSLDELLSRKLSVTPSRSGAEGECSGAAPKRPMFVLLAFLLYAGMAALGLALLFVTIAGSTRWGREEVFDPWATHLKVESHAIRSTEKGALESLVRGAQFRRFSVGMERMLHLVSGQLMNELIVYWGLPLGLILCALAVSTVPERHVVLDWMSPASAVLGQGVPVKWAKKLCAGGISVGEALFIFVFALRNGLMIAWTLRETGDMLDARHAEAAITGVPVPRPDWYFKLDGVALSLGVTSFQNMMWLFFPIVRISPLFDALGLPFEKRIRYHRWLGHFTMIILATHGFLYWIVRMSVDQWVEEALQWTDHRNVNNFAGGISLMFGLALWVTALEWTRRRYFEVFYRTHIIGFLGFLLFGILHAPGMHVYLGAGLLIYCLDLVLRLTQLSTPVKVKWSGSTSDGSIAVIGFDTVKPLCPFSTFFVNIGSISKCQWHPVTPVMMGGGTGMKVCFKKFGNWTSKVVEEAAAGRLTTVKLEGPYSSTPDSCHFQEHEYLVMVAGGIAITPLLTILKKLVIANAKDLSRELKRTRTMKGRISDEPTPRDAKTFRRKVVVLWTMRNIAEAELMDEELFAYSRARPDLLDIRIHHTGKDKVDNWTGKMIRGENKLEDADIISGEFGVGKGGKVVSFKEGTKGGAGPVKVDPEVKDLMRPGGLVNRVSPSTLPQHGGPLHLAGLHVLVYLAAFMGLILGISYSLEATRTGEEVSRGKVDTVVAFSMFMMAIGAVTLFIFPRHLKLYEEAQESHAKQEAAPPKAAKQLSSTTILFISRTQDIDMDGLDLVAGPREISDTPVFSKETIEWIKKHKKSGRPNVDAVLDDVNSNLSPGHTAAVITAGPMPMINSVRKAVSKRNKRFHLKNPLKFEMETFAL